MKPLGTPDNEDEARAERALSRFTTLTLRTLTYRVALPAVASPSYHAVESATFDIAPDGTEPTLFLKLAGDETKELVDDAISFAAATRLHDLGLSPKPIARAPLERAVLWERLGQGWRVAKIDDLMHEAPVSQLIKMQKAIAAGPLFGRPWSIFEGIDGLWAIMQTLQAPLPGDASWMYAWTRTLHSAISAAGVDFCAAHGDPHSSNVMIGPSGQLQWVDFDMAGDMDPYYQLGVQMNELYQFESQMQPLLEMHDGAFSTKAFARCRLYAAADDFYWALRSMLLEMRSPRRSVEFLKYAEWRFLRCRMLLGRPGFEELVRSI
ncbi:phosphotransferase family protein [Agrobacterium vitis]